MVFWNVNEFGGWLVGLVIEHILFGLMTVQTFMYFSHYPRDHVTVKVTIGFLFIVQAFYASCMSYAVYHDTVTAFSLAQAQSSDLRSHWTWQFITFHEADFVTSFTVQTFFVWRIYKMSESLWLSAFVESLAIGQLVCAILIDIGIHENTSMPDFLKNHQSIVFAWLSLQAVADIFIAGSMVYLLRQRRTGFKSTETLINRLLLYSVATGLTTSVISLISLAVIKAAGFGFFVDVIAMNFSGLYAVNMLSNLHTRQSLAEQGRARGIETDISMRIVERFGSGAGGCRATRNSL